MPQGPYPPFDLRASAGCGFSAPVLLEICGNTAGDVGRAPAFLPVQRPLRMRRPCADSHVRVIEAPNSHKRVIVSGAGSWPLASGVRVRRRSGGQSRRGRGGRRGVP